MKYIFFGTFLSTVGFIYCIKQKIRNTKQNKYEGEEWWDQKTGCYYVIKILVKKFN